MPVDRPRSRQKPDTQTSSDGAAIPGIEPEERRVRQTEDRAIHADAERERGDRAEREDRVARQRSKRVFEVLDHDRVRYSARSDVTGST